MTALYAIGAVLLALLVAAHTYVRATVLGQMFAVPVLGIIALTILLLVLALILLLVRQIIREGFGLRPVARTR